MFTVWRYGPPHNPHILAPDQEQDSARFRSAPSDQRTLSCRIRNTAGFFSVERDAGRPSGGSRPSSNICGRLPHGAVADALATVRASQAFGRPQAGVRVPGADGGAVRRGPAGDVGRDRSPRGCVDRTCRTHEGTTRAPRAAVRSRRRNPARSEVTRQRHWTRVPEHPLEGAVGHDALEGCVEVAQRSRPAINGYYCGGWAGLSSISYNPPCIR